MIRLLTISIFTITIQLTYSQDKIIIKQSECDPNNSNPYELRERVINKEIRNDSLIILLGKREICCAKFIGHFKIENDTLKINYENIGDECFCTCFYELTFKIPQRIQDSLYITFNGLQFEQTNKKFAEYITIIDTLENGRILWSKYEGDELILEIEDQDSFKIYRHYYKGLLKQEQKLKSR